MSGHPTCEIEMDYVPGRKYFTAGDDLKGKIKIKTTVEGQQINHQGIKVSLLGMILQIPEHTVANQKNTQGMNIGLDEKRSEITAQNVSKYRQYTFMQIQKEIECSSDFTNFKELEFRFKNLDEELNDHETYNGIDNFVKYFIKVHMTYQGGSIVSGNTLEKLFEFEVKNYYTHRAAKKKQEEQKSAP